MVGQYLKIWRASRWVVGHLVRESRGSWVTFSYIWVGRCGSWVTWVVGQFSWPTSISAYYYPLHTPSILFMALLRSVFWELMVHERLVPRVGVRCVIESQLTQRKSKDRLFCDFIGIYNFYIWQSKRMRLVTRTRPRIEPAPENARF